MEMLFSLYVCTYIVRLFMYTVISNDMYLLVSAVCIQMEEINIPMVKGSMDDIGDEEVNF